MTLKKMIELLEKQDNSTKQEVLLMLKNAKIEELIELRNSINEEIRLKRGKLWLKVKKLERKIEE